MKSQVVIFLVFFGLAIAAPHHSKEKSSESHEKDDHDHMHGNGTEMHGHENGTEHHGPEHGPEHNGTELEHNETMHGEAPRAKRDWQSDLTNKISGGAADVQQWAKTAEQNTQNWLNDQKQNLQQGAQQAQNWLQTQGQKIEQGFNNMNNQNQNGMGQMNLPDMSKMNFTNLQPIPGFNGQNTVNNQAGQPQIQILPNSNANPSGSSSFGMSSSNGGQMVFPNQATGNNGNQLALQPNANNGQNPAAEFIKNNIAVSASPSAPQWVIQTSKPWWKFWSK